MVALQKINDSMFDDIYREFLVDDDPDLTRDDWQRLFECRTETGQDCAGYALVDGSKIGGILGMLFNNRHVDGNERKFCSLHTWMVDPEYRGHSLLMMRPAMRLSDHTVNDFTPTTPVQRLSKRLGFKELDSALRVMLPYGGFGAKKENVEFLSDRESVQAQLTGDDLKFFHDHQMPHIGHLLCSAGSDHCYLIYSRVTRWRLPYCHVHYISDPSIFAKNSIAIRKQILKKESVNVLVGNDRQLGRFRLPRSFRFTFTNGHLYRSKTTSPDQIDSLYSDIAHLNLTTVNAMSAVIKEKIRWQ
ncbi:MAG: hypothetical protein GY903_07980 [Fuerstiella sp.]|nr:hypothetical protein [Fuerstiella sp.]MCP4782954.1 hypothetical protein [Fuerstiella sp.]MCP4854417.1 hypothetical protein [Fuerstiella sp.]